MTIHRTFILIFVTAVVAALLYTALEALTPSSRVGAVALGIALGLLWGWRIQRSNGGKS